MSDCTQQGFPARLPRAVVLALDVELLSEKVVKVVLELVGVMVAFRVGQQGSEASAADTDKTAVRALASGAAGLQPWARSQGQ